MTSETKKRTRNSVPSSTRAKKSKGRFVQNLTRDLILATFPLFPDDVKTTSMGVRGVDIQLSPKARLHFNYDVECKNDENISVWSAYQQAKDNSKLGTPVVFMKRNYSDILAVVNMTHFFELLSEIDKSKFPQKYNPIIKESSDEQVEEVVRKTVAYFKDALENLARK